MSRASESAGDIHPVAWLLELRVKVRGNREATAIVDRSLALVAQAEAAEPDALAGLMDEVQRLGDELALWFGAPKAAVLQ
jgi:hypothetical protein